MQQMQTLWDQKSIIEPKSHAVLAGNVQVDLWKAQLLPFGKKVPGLPIVLPASFLKMTPIPKVTLSEV